MICSKCGAQIPDDAKFCGVCGNSIAADNTAPVQPTAEETINTPAPEATETAQTETVASETSADAPADAAEPVQADDTPVQQDAPDYNGYNPTPQPEFQNSSTDNGFQQAPNFGSPTQNSDGNAAKNGLLILGGIVVAAVVVIILLFSLIFGGNSWKDVIKDSVKFLNSRDDDIEDYYRMTYGEICGEFNYEQDKLLAELKDNDDWEDDILDTIDYTYESFDDEYGDDWKIDYEIKSKKELADSKLDDAADNWEDAIDGLEDTLKMLEDIDDPEDYNDELDEDDLEKLIKFYEKWIKKLEDEEVKKGYKVKYTIIIEGDDDDDKNTTTSNIVKIDGKWVEDSFYFSYPDLY